MTEKSRIQNYLKEKLENCSKYELNEQDRKLIEKEGIENYIFSKLMSKKF